MPAQVSFHELLSRGGIQIAPGVFDGLSAKLVEKTGFECLYASGGAIARSTGVPDIGLLSLDEVVKRMEQIVDAVKIPVIADMDTGFGNVINTRRAVQLFERAGVSAVHIEDQTFPKRCGHLNDKNLITPDEMVMKIKAAVNARTSKNFTIIARTDAIAVEGLNAAIDRANRYTEAGAEMIFIEAPVSEEQIKTIGEQIKAPLLINMFATGKTPLVPIDKLESWGYKLVIIPSDLQRAALYGMKQTLNAIKASGDSRGVQDQMFSFPGREDLVETNKYLQLDELL